jgi:quercetin dioxygenase-like cupin family protein
MAHEGQELEGPNGLRLRFVRITEDLLEMEARYPEEGSLPPPHLHPRQNERFTVLDGVVLAVIDGREAHFDEGETFDVPAGMIHQMAGDGSARVKWQVRPALRSAQFFEDLYTGAAAADPGGFLERYEDEIRLVAQPQDTPATP